MHARELQNALSGVGFLDFPEISIPDWMQSAVSECSNALSKPDAKINTEAGTSQLNRWIVDFAYDVGLSSHFYCRTGMRFFPWVEISVSQANWPEMLRASLGRDLVLASHDKNALVIVFEEEYEIIAFRYSDDAKDRKESALTPEDRRLSKQ